MMAIAAIIVGAASLGLSGMTIFYSRQAGAAYREIARLRALRGQP